MFSPDEIISLFSSYFLSIFLFEYYLSALDAQIYRWPQGRPFFSRSRVKDAFDFQESILDSLHSGLLNWLHHLLSKPAPPLYVLSVKATRVILDPPPLPPSSTSLRHQSSVSSTSYIYLDSPTCFPFHHPSPSPCHFSLVCCNEALLKHTLSCFLSVYFPCVTSPT